MHLQSTKDHSRFPRCNRGLGKHKGKQRKARGRGNVIWTVCWEVVLKKKKKKKSFSVVPVHFPCVFKWHISRGDLSLHCELYQMLPTSRATMVPIATKHISESGRLQQDSSPSLNGQPSSDRGCNIHFCTSGVVYSSLKFIQLWRGALCVMHNTKSRQRRR